MDSDLTLLLRENGVIDEVSKALLNAGCIRVNLMAHWFEERGEVTAFLETIAPAKGGMVQRAALRFVSAKSQELSTRALRRSIPGVEEAFWMNHCHQNINETFWPDPYHYIDGESSIRGEFVATRNSRKSG